MLLHIGRSRQIQPTNENTIKTQSRPARALSSVEDSRTRGQTPAREGRKVQNWDRPLLLLWSLLCPCASRIYCISCCPSCPACALLRDDFHIIGCLWQHLNSPCLGTAYLVQCVDMQQRGFAGTESNKTLTDDGITGGQRLWSASGRPIGGRQTETNRDRSARHRWTKAVDLQILQSKQERKQQDRCLFLVPAAAIPQDWQRSTRRLHTGSAPGNRTSRP